MAVSKEKTAVKFVYIPSSKHMVYYAQTNIYLQPNGQFIYTTIFKLYNNTSSIFVECGLKKHMKLGTTYDYIYFGMKRKESKTKL